MSDGLLLLLLPSEGSSMLTCTGLVQGLACGFYDNDESLLFSLRVSHDGLSHGRSIVLLPLCDGGGSLVLVDGEAGGTFCHGR
jgi:hypothetical protein